MQHTSDLFPSQNGILPGVPGVPLSVAESFPHMPCVPFKSLNEYLISICFLDGR